MESKELFEAPASLNFNGVSQKGWRLQFTLRDFDEQKLLDRFGKFVGLLEEKHISPNGQTATMRGEPVGADMDVPVLTPIVPNNPPDPWAESPQPGTFQAETLVGNVSDGKRYWKVKGGKFSKFGVTVWDEVLKEAGFNVGEMDPMMQYNLTGYIATYVEQPNKEGKLVPHKVTKLTK